MNSESTLEDVRVVDLSLNVPGPVATARLRDLGATVIKVEPPSGDPLAGAAPDWCTELAAGKVRETLDLKTPTGKERLARLLADADLLVTAFRPSALQRLGLAWKQLSEAHPRLCQVAIVGHPAPHRERPGHDLTYQAQAGLVDPPDLPRSLFVDCLGAERAVSACLEALLRRDRTGEATYREVALADAGTLLAQPRLHGVTTPDGFAGGGDPRYGIYRTADGWIALAALEDRLWQRFIRAFADAEPEAGEDGALREPDLQRVRQGLDRMFRRYSVAELRELGECHGLPLAPVVEPGRGQ